MVSCAGVIPVTVVPVLYPAIVVDLPSFTLRWLGLSTTLCFLLLSFGAPLVGRFVDRIGPRGGMTVAALGTLATLGMIATTTSLAVLVTVIAVSGVFHSFAATSSNLVMGAVLDGRRPATLFGVRQTAVPLMSMLAGSVVAVASGWLGWRAILLLFAVVPVALLLFRPERAARVERVHPRDLAPLPRRELIVFAMISLFSGMAVSVLATFGVATLTEAGWSPANSGGIFAVASALGLATRIVAGIVVDRRRWSVFTFAGSLLVGGAIGAGLISSGASTWIAVGVLLAYGAGWGFPGLLQYGIAVSFRARIASATGLVQLGSGLGVSLGPLLFSSLEGVVGMGPAWAVVGVSSGLAATIALWRAYRGDAEGDPQGHVNRTRRHDGSVS